MKNQETTEPSRSRKKPRSPYFGVRIMSVTLGLLAILLIAGTIYLMFEHNAQGESCAYVEPGEPYHLVLENGPCRITSTEVVEIIVIVVLLLGASQFLPLIFWAVTAYQIHLSKNPPPLPADWEFTRDFGEFARPFNCEDSGQEERDSAPVRE